MALIEPTTITELRVRDDAPAEWWHVSTDVYEVYQPTIAELIAHVLDHLHIYALWTGGAHTPEMRAAFGTNPIFAEVRQDIDLLLSAIETITHMHFTVPPSGVDYAEHQRDVDARAHALLRDITATMPRYRHGWVTPKTNLTA